MPVLRLFGHAAVERDGVSEPLGVSAKAVALAGILAANHTRPVSREWLAQTLWPDADPADARANLRRHLHLLTKALGENPFLLTRQNAQWNADSPLAVDAIEFDRFLSADPQHAVAYYSGEFCEGVPEEALDALRTRYRTRFERALHDLRNSAQAAADDRALLRWLERLLAHDPLDEQIAREAIAARIRTGDRAGAIREYHALAERLRMQLGVEPEPETAALWDRLLAPPQKHAAPNNLRPAPTSFVGRENELAQIASSTAPHVLVTLAGAGGIGKSRLALRYCWSNLSRYPGGVRFVELAAAGDEAAIWLRIAEACELPVQDDARAVVMRALQHSEALLVLDNCEHVLEDAANVASALLAETACALIATTRKPLGVPGECVMPVSPLQMPPETPKNSDDLLRYSGSRLFLERAAVSAPSFRVDEREAHRVAQIVRRLDGLPLAIELVAARANVLTVEGMLKRLNEREIFAHRSRRAEDRHRTLHAAIAWSYELLSESERALLSRLSVFAAPFSLSAAQAICGTGGSDISPMLFELVDASLVRPLAEGDEVRYELLQTTQQFARERLRERGEAADYERRFAGYFAEIGDMLAPLDATHFFAAFEPYVPDAVHFSAALEWAIASREIDIAARIADGYFRYQRYRGLPRRMLERIEALLEIAETSPGMLGLERCARMHRIAGILANTCTEWRASRLHNGRANELFEAAGNEVAASNALTGLAAAEYYAGDFEAAERVMQEAMAKQERFGNPGVLARTVSFLGALYLATGRLAQARPLLERAAQLFHQAGDAVESRSQLKNLALTAYYENRLDDAKHLLDQVLIMASDTGDVHVYADAINLYGNVLRKGGDLPQAFRKHAAALELAPQLEGSHYLAEILEDVSITFTAAGDDRSAALAGGGAKALRQRLRSPVNPIAEAELAAAHETARARLGAERFAALFLRGGHSVDNGLVAELQAAFP